MEVAGRQVQDRDVGFRKTSYCVEYDLQYRPDLQRRERVAKLGMATQTSRLTKLGEWETPLDNLRAIACRFFRLIKLPDSGP